MPVSNEEKFDFLSKIAPFNHLPEDDLLKISSMTRVIVVPKGKNLFSQGDKTNNLYLLYSGTAEALVTHKEGEKEQGIRINLLKKGDFIGEISFLTQHVHSATIAAIDDCVFFEISGEGLFKELKFGLYKELTNIVISRLHNSNVKYMESTLKLLEKEAHARSSGVFFICILISLMLGDVTTYTASLLKVNLFSGIYNWTYLILILLPILFFIYKFKFSLHDFGVTRFNLKKSFIESIFISMGIILFTGFCFYLYGKFVDDVLWQRFINFKTSKVFELSFLIYIVHAYLQEFIARGVVQSSMKRFLLDKSGFASIFVTSTLFGVLHLQRGLIVVILAFLISVLFGIIYNRQRNLVGVSIIHFFTGAIAAQLTWI